MVNQQDKTYFVISSFLFCGYIFSREILSVFVVFWGVTERYLNTGKKIFFEIELSCKKELLAKYQIN